ncbi:MAG: tetratricopeptide repeat protein, partial [Microcoleus sp. SIO2G3]|nr:tetratricopeptide repeat protein [Microcoleus sp. SIO2G3]
AVADYNQVTQLNPVDYRAYYNRGLARFEQEDYQGAIADYNQALRQILRQDNQELATIYNDRGLAYLQQGNLSGATLDFSKAIRFNVNDARAYYNRGCACHRQGDYAGAIRDFTHSLQHHPNQAEAYVNRGLVRYQIGYQQAAFEDLYRAAKCFCDQGQIRAYRQTLNLIQKLRQPSPISFEVA